MDNKKTANQIKEKVAELNDLILTACSDGAIVVKIEIEPLFGLMHNIPQAQVRIFQRIG